MVDSYGSPHMVRDYISDHYDDNSMVLTVGYKDSI